VRGFAPLVRSLEQRETPVPPAWLEHFPPPPRSTTWGAVPDYTARPWGLVYGGKPSPASSRAPELAGSVADELEPDPTMRHGGGVAVERRVPDVALGRLDLRDD